MQTELDLTLCMIVRNEEEHLERCLSSLPPTLSERIVVDTGSTDRTVEIAKRYGCHVLQLVWEHDFSAARNAGLQQATKSWILVLDADEEVDPLQWEQVPALLQQAETSGYYIQLKSYVGAASGGEFFVDSVCRLFRNHPSIRFQGLIHEDVVSSLLESFPNQLQYSAIQILHYGYVDSVVQQKKKHERNLHLLRAALEADADDLYLQYALGTEYFQQNQYAEALEVWEPVLPKVPVFSGYSSDLILKSVFALREVKRLEDAWRVANKALAFYPDFADLLELSGILLLDLGYFQNSLHLLQKTRQISADRKSDSYTLTSGTGTYRTDYWIGLVQERRLDWESAVQQYRQAVLQQPAFTAAWDRYWSLTLLQNQHFLQGPVEAVFHTPLSMHSLLQGAIRGHQTDWAQLALERLSTAKCPTELRFHILLDLQTSRIEQALHKIDILATTKKTQEQGLLYRWATQLKLAKDMAAMKTLEQLVNTNATYAPMVELLKGEQPLQVSTASLGQCQDVLLLTGAWDAFLRIQEQPPLQQPSSWLPSRWLLSWLQAPRTEQQRLVELGWKRFDHLLFQETIGLGVLALFCMHPAAVELWNRVRQQPAGKLVGTWALSHLYIKQASRHLHDKLPSETEHALSCLAMWDL